MHIVSHDALADLQHVAKRERDARRRIRIQIIVLAMQNRTAPQISQALGVSRRSLQHWVGRYNNKGS